MSVHQICEFYPFWTKKNFLQKDRHSRQTLGKTHRHRSSNSSLDIVCMQLTAFQYVRYALNLQSHHDAMACEACSACSSSACMRDICIKTFTNDISEPMESLKIWGETKSKGDIISEIVQFFSISIKLRHMSNLSG